MGRQGALEVFTFVSEAGTSSQYGGETFSDPSGFRVNPNA